MSKPIDLRNLDYRNSGSWPMPVKAASCLLIIIAIVALAWYLFVADRRVTLQTLEGEEATLKGEFEEKQGRAANLEPLKAQLAQMEVMLQQMLRQLPSKTEMPDLIVDVSQTALATGIANELFQPGAETPRDFYAEKPISLRMSGSYHQFGAFVSGVASLPRVVIMTMHDISLTAASTTDDTLRLSGTVKTYRYLDEEEAAEAESAAGGAK